SSPRTSLMRSRRPATPPRSSTGGGSSPRGSIAELISDRHPHFDLACGNPRAALSILTGHPAVVQASETPTGLRVTLADPRAAGIVTARLTDAGITVSGFAPVRTSLADRFLGLTSRVGDHA